MDSNSDRLGKHRWRLTLTLVFGTFCVAISDKSAWAGAMLFQQAWTEDAMTISATLNSASGAITLLSGQNALANASTASYATAVTANYETPANQGKVPWAGTQSAYATSAAVANKSPSVTTGGTFNNPLPIASFYSAQTTIAAAGAPIPLFARAATFSTAEVSGIHVTGNSGTNQSIGISWNFNQLGLGSLPPASLAYISNTVEISQQSAAGITSTSFGFTALSMNGKQSASVMQPPGNSSVSDWLIGNTVWQGNQMVLSPQAQSMQLSVPLLKSADGISIKNVDVGVSYEASPRATIQQGLEAGYIPSATGSQSQIHWNSSTGQLTFDRLPLDVLSTGWTGDALFSGFLEIDPLTFLGNTNGLDYFSGGDIRLVSQSGDVLFTAQVPTFVFEDSLISLQGFDLFAPILNISGIQSDLSAWLKDYVNKLTPDSTLLPELYMGFSLPDPGSNIWANSFNEPVTAILSFAGTVPEPSTLALTAIGIALFFGSYRKKSSLHGDTKHG